MAAIAESDVARRSHQRSLVRMRLAWLGGFVAVAPFLGCGDDSSGAGGGGGGAAEPSSHQAVVEAAEVLGNAIDDYEGAAQGQPHASQASAPAAVDSAFPALDDSTDVYVGALVALVQARKAAAASTLVEMQALARQLEMVLDTRELLVAELEQAEGDEAEALRQSIAALDSQRDRIVSSLQALQSELDAWFAKTAPAPTGRSKVKGKLRTDAEDASAPGDSAAHLTLGLLVGVTDVLAVCVDGAGKSVPVRVVATSGEKGEGEGMAKWSANVKAARIGQLTVLAPKGAACEVSIDTPASAPPPSLSKEALQELHAAFAARDLRLDEMFAGLDRMSGESEAHTGFAAYVRGLRRVLAHVTSGRATDLDIAAGLAPDSAEFGSNAANLAAGETSPEERERMRVAIETMMKRVETLNGASATEVRLLVDPVVAAHDGVIAALLKHAPPPPKKK
jgi:hypothetical protein